ncbi:hypothetical protein MMC22_011479 [Lobaria immixta]|nr:hypothetical protein [Lobaria immixta]
MFPATTTRRLACMLPRLRAASQASFHTSRPAWVNVGDRVPDLTVLVENSPGNKVNLSQELGKGLIIGVPAAFTWRILVAFPNHSDQKPNPQGPSCSATHIPGYINSPNLKNAGKVFVVSVNDPFVMKAWGSTLDPKGKSGIRFLGDPTTEFTTALDLAFDGSAIFGGHRSKRYALVIEDGKVKQAFVEPDNTGLDGELPAFFLL